MRVVTVKDFNCKGNSLKAPLQTLEDSILLQGVEIHKGAKYKAFVTTNFAWVVFQHSNDVTLPKYIFKE